MANKKILVVEDDILLQETMKDRLEANNYDVVVADNGKEGVFKAITEKPDIIIADLLMPETDGIEMTKIIRSNSDLKNVPIIVASALGRESDVKKALDAGANDYVVKPYSFKDLLEKLEEMLK